MTIEEFKQKKRDIEAKITDLLYSLEEESGMRVTDIDYKRKMRLDEDGFPFCEHIGCRVTFETD